MINKRFSNLTGELKNEVGYLLIKIKEDGQRPSEVEWKVVGFTSSIDRSNQEF